MVGVWSLGRCGGGGGGWLRCEGGRRGRVRGEYVQGVAEGVLLR